MAAERTGFKVLLSRILILERNKSRLGERGADCRVCGIGMFRILVRVSTLPIVALS